uniref:Rho-GAP domain-containing protein n=1 Tax=Echinostoma caproni TaxID=27848 RepID=A0A183B515_9TREM
LDFLQQSGPGIRLVHLLIDNAETLFAEDKIALSHLLKDRSNCVTFSTHSRSPSNASLTDFKPPKPTAPRLYPSIPDEPVKSVADPSHNPTNSIPAIGFLIQDLSDIDSLEPRTAPGPDSSQGQTLSVIASPSRQPRKKTAAPKPPVPASLPQSVGTSILPSPRDPPYPSTPASDPNNHRDPMKTPLGDQASVPTACSAIHFTPAEDARSKSPSRTEESSQLKAPPKRPPRPGSNAPK